MYRQFLAQYFNNDEIQMIGSVVELIKSEDPINVDIAFGILKSIGLFRRLLDVLVGYCKDVTFHFESKHTPYNQPHPSVLAKYMITIYENESPILPTLEKLDLTTQEKGVLFYSFESGFGERYKSYLGCVKWGSVYENIPIPIFAKELKIYANEPTNKLSLRNYELFNTPVSECYLELEGDTPIELPYLNIKYELIFKLSDYTLHMKSVFDNLLQYPDLKKFVINTYLFEKTSVRNMVAHFHLPNNIHEFELYESLETILTDFENSKKFIEKLICSNLLIIKLVSRRGIKLPDTTISILNKYNFSYEDDGWTKVYFLYRNI